MAHNAHAGKLHERRAAAEHDPRGGHVLVHVEFFRVLPVVGVPAQPHNHDPLPDFGVDQQCGGDVRNRADGDDVERTLGRVLHGERGQAARGGGIHRRVLVGQIAVRAAQGERMQVLPAHERQDVQNFPVALFHALRCVLRLALHGERRGVQAFQVKPVPIEHEIGQRVLVVRFVKGVRIQHNVDFTFRAFQIFQKLFARHRNFSSIFPKSIFGFSTPERRSGNKYITGAYAVIIPYIVHICNICKARNPAHSCNNFRGNTR